MSGVFSGDLTGLRAAETAPLREKWGYMVAFGALVALAGFAALGSVVGSTVLTVLFVGAAMIVSGIVEMIYAVAVRSWKKFFLWSLIGLLYVVGGATVIQNPLFAASFLTLVLGAGLVASGLVRSYLAFQLPKTGPWGLVALSGLLTLALGAIILAKWPVSSLYVLGIFLGVDLIVAGSSWIGLGLSLKRSQDAQAVGIIGSDRSIDMQDGFAPGMGRKLFAEFLGTFWLVFGGVGSALISAGFPQLGIGFTGVSLAFGLSRADRRLCLRSRVGRPFQSGGVARSRGGRPVLVEGTRPLLDRAAHRRDFRGLHSAEDLSGQYRFLAVQRLCGQWL